MGKRGMNTIRIAAILMFGLVFLGSCDLFIGVPHARENIYDNAAQLTSFIAAPSGTDSIITMWDWRDVKNWLGPDDQISEIKILQSTKRYPELNTDNDSETFNSGDTWYCDWEGLSVNTTHYFSLFIKDNNGIWFAPLRVKARLPGVLKPSMVYGITNSQEVQDSLTYVEDKTSSISVRNNGSPNSVLVVTLSLPKNVYITNATLTTSTTTGLDTTGDLRVYPVRKFWNEDPYSVEGYEELTDSSNYNYVVDDSVNAAISSTTNTITDVTEVVRKAFLYNPHQIVFKFDGSGSATVNVHGSAFLTMDYYQSE